MLAEGQLKNSMATVEHQFEVEEIEFPRFPEDTKVTKEYKYPYLATW